MLKGHMDSIARCQVFDIQGLKEFRCRGAEESLLRVCYRELLSEADEEPGVNAGCLFGGLAGEDDLSVEHSPLELLAGFVKFGQLKLPDCLEQSLLRLNLGFLLRLRPLLYSAQHQCHLPGHRVRPDGG